MPTRLSTLLALIALLSPTLPGIAFANPGRAPSKPTVTARTRATTIEMGRVYEGRVRLVAAEAGVSFTLPEGHQGVLPQGTRWFMVGTRGGTGRILMTADQFDTDQAAALMASPIDLGDGVQLLPTTAPQRRGTRITGHYRVVGAGQPLSAIANTVVGPHGVGVAMLAIAPAASLPQLDQTLQALRRSLRFTALPQTNSRSHDVGRSNADAGALAGLRLVRYHTVSGYTEKTTLELCRDGRFLRHFNASSATSLGTGAALGNHAGRYAIRDGQLMLHYRDGTRASYRVDNNRERLLLDGKKWFRLQGACQ